MNRLLSLCCLLSIDDALALRVAATPQLLPAGQVRRCSGCVAAADYVSQATSLFANVRLPASILAGALVPLGFGFALPLEGPAYEQDTRRALIRAHRLIAVVAYSSLLTCIIYSSVSINALVEVSHAPSASVIELIRREYELPWVATNVTFLFGLCGALVLVALRACLTWEREEGQVAAGFCGAALLLMASVVDDQVKLGGYSANVVQLVVSYGAMLLDAAAASRSPLLCASVALGLSSSAAAAALLLRRGAPRGGAAAAATGGAAAAAQPARALTTSPVDSVASTVAGTGGLGMSSGDAAPSADVAASADGAGDVEASGAADGGGKVVGDAASIGDCC